jgi:NAD(P)-dependent dehydrogenase (short-subunit alcohol dehydrogenase family)
LHGRRALVTASTAGIGFAIAEGLAEAGAAVVLNGRSSATIDRAVQPIRNSLPDASVDGVAADAASAEGAAALIARAPELDILVNNFGAFEPKPFFAIEDADWMRFFETNVLSGARLSRQPCAAECASAVGGASSSS